MLNTNQLSEAEIQEQRKQKIMQGVAAWASYYRANPHRFVRDYFDGINLKRFQEIILYQMFHSVNIMFLAARGIGKTMLLAIYCAIKCILYPGTTICIASKTRQQAIEVIDKITKNLMPHSPLLCLEIKETINNSAKAYIDFKNTSRIVVVTANESARHNRATVLIVDEFVWVDKNITDTVLRNFLTSPRHPGFLDKPEYHDYPFERPQELYCSSCWYESHWSYEFVRSYAINMVMGRGYFVCAIPYQLGIKERILQRENIEDKMSESTFNEVKFLMENCALFFKQSDGAFYNFEDIDRTRVIKFPYYPASYNVQLADKRVYIPPKAKGEIRILSADIALMSSRKNNNDATSIFLNQMLPDANGKYYCNITYTENNEGLRTEDQALRIRKLFSEFACDYLVIDGRGLGLGVCDALMGDIYDKNDGVTYPALSCCNNEEMASRCTTPDAPKVIWVIYGTPEFNSQCALGLREIIRQKRLRLLLSEFAADDVLPELNGYKNLKPDDLTELKMPYIHTSLLINELINLQYETRNGVVKIKEKPGMRKDRYSSLSYNVYVAKQLERDIVAEQKKSLDKLVFKIRTPQLKGQTIF